MRGLFVRQGETRRPDFKAPQEHNRESGTVTAIVGYFWGGVKNEEWFTEICNKNRGLYFKWLGLQDFCKI